MEKILQKKEYIFEFTEGFSKLVDALIEKYSLGPVDPYQTNDFFDSLIQAKDDEETKKVFENFPFEKIISLIKKILTENLNKKIYINIIKNRFNLSDKTASDLADDIEKILPLVKKADEVIIPKKEFFPKMEMPRVGAKISDSDGEISNAEISSKEMENSAENENYKNDLEEVDVGEDNLTEKEYPPSEKRTNSNDDYREQISE